MHSKLGRDDDAFLLHLNSFAGLQPANLFLPYPLSSQARMKLDIGDTDFATATDLCSSPYNLQHDPVSLCILAVFIQSEQ